MYHTHYTCLIIHGQIKPNAHYYLYLLTMENSNRIQISMVNKWSAAFYGHVSGKINEKQNLCDKICRMKLKYHFISFLTGSVTVAMAIRSNHQFYCVVKIINQIYKWVHKFCKVFENAYRRTELKHSIQNIDKKHTKKTGGNSATSTVLCIACNKYQKSFTRSNLTRANIYVYRFYR